MGELTPREIELHKRGHIGSRYCIRMIASCEQGTFTPLYCQLLEECLTHSKCSVNICWGSEWRWKTQIPLILCLVFQSQSPCLYKEYINTYRIIYQAGHSFTGSTLHNPTPCNLQCERYPWICTTQQPCSWMRHRRKKPQMEPDEPEFGSALPLSGCAISPLFPHL